MGSLNYAKYSAARKDFVFQFVFANPFDEIVELLEAMRELSIKPEHECFDVGHVASLAPLVEMGLLDAPLHADFVMGVLGGVPATTRDLARMADTLAEAWQEHKHHWGVIGIGRAQWRMVAAALTLGGSVRVGLEDNFYLPDGTMARSNGDLVARARRLCEDCGGGRRRSARPGTLLGIAAVRGGRAREPAAGRRHRARPQPAAAGRILLVPAVGLRRRRDQGRGHRRRRLRALGAAALRGRGRDAGGALFLALNRGKRSIRIDLKSERGPRCCGARPLGPTCCWSRFGPA